MPPATDWTEQIAADEAERFARHAEVLAALQKKRGKVTVHRALHAKANLGVEARFEVLPDLPADARVGMFAEPKSYSAFVRFSNGAGRQQSDAKPDVRGIAVKVLGVGGKKVIPGMEDAKTQDFLAIRTASVPMRDADEFITLVRAADTPALLPFKLIRALGVRRALQIIKSVVAGFKVPMTSLASTTYYSALPMKYGPYAAKFALFPNDAATPLTGRDPTSIGDELVARLRERAVNYEFRVQFFVDATQTPIEDPTVEWKTDYITVARLTLPVQDPTSPRGKQIAEYVESLAFDPWHAGEELRPLGNMMRARNHAYRASTKARGAAAEPVEAPRFE
ncbi:MAG: Catalase [Myxococcales bacterium]|nr:Catalase [Myxococcales bacterium]